MVKRAVITAAAWGVWVSVGTVVGVAEVLDRGLRFQPVRGMVGWVWVKTVRER